MVQPCQIFLQQLTLCKVESINVVSLFTASPSGVWMEDKDNRRKECKQEFLALREGQ